MTQVGSLAKEGSCQKAYRLRNAVAGKQKTQSKHKDHGAKFEEETLLALQRGSSFRRRMSYPRGSIVR